MKRSTITLGTVYKTKSGRWRAAIDVGTDGRGRRIRRTVSASTRAEVMRRRDDLYTDLKSGATAPADITVATFMDRWLNTTAFEHYSPGSLANARSHVRRHITPTLGAYNLGDLGAEEVRELDAAVRASGASDRTVQTVRSTFAVAMSDAVRQGMLDVSPTDRVPHPRAVTGTRDPLTVTEARRVLRSAVEAGDPLAGLWAGYLLLAPRKNELLGLEWDRVDLDAGLVDLSWSMVQVPWRHGPGCRCRAGARGSECPVRVQGVPPGFEARPMHGALMWGRPKTARSRRVVPVPEVMVEVLRAQAVAGSNRWGLVWTGPKGGPLRPDRALKLWKSALRRAGVREVDLHTTRHTASSLLRTVGVGPEVIAVILGHVRVSTTFGYIHADQTRVRAAVDGLGELLGPGAGVESPEEGDGLG